MRVSLNYYRILMLPMQTADLEKVEAAYHERLTQALLPGFSQDLVAARSQLLATAHSTLLNPEARAAYAEHLLVGDLGLDVSLSQAIASVVIFCELGEYDQALSLAETLQQQGFANRDVVLAATWALMLWGREQWQEGDYETAAARLNEAQSVLQQAQAFPEVQASITADLLKLRPYRVMQLLDHPDLESVQRQQGIQLLQTMLDERQGIEGRSDDGSGLGTEDFLRFIQKIRSYLSAAEQQALFEAEAERPSIVATYLAISALIVQGFIEHRPVLLRRARGYLVRLGQRHDVCIEQAICALLLGQTEIATQTLAQCQDSQAMAFIHDHSGDDIDLLPGLCRYIEHWLTTEALPGFRDTQNKTVAISDYFDDPKVQAYLTELPQGDDLGSILDLPAFATSAPIPDLHEEAAYPPAPAYSDDAEPLRTPPVATSQPLAPAYPPMDAYPPTEDNVSAPTQAPAAAITSPLRRRRRDTSKLWLWQLGGGALVLFLLWLMGRALMALFTNPGQPPVEQPLVSLEEPPVAIAPAETLAPTPPPVPNALDAATAEALVADWQEAKQEALGQNYNALALETILAEPLLSQWRARSQQMAEVNAYYIYTFRSLTVESVTPAEGSGTAIIEVNEAAAYWQDNVEIAGNSYDSTYRVRYTFERQPDRWLITASEQL